MKLIKGRDIVDLNNPGTISAYLQEGYVEYSEPAKKARRRTGDSSEDETN